MKFAGIVLLVSLCGGVFSSNECKCTTLGTEYQGKKNTTFSGIECQRWDVEVTHEHFSLCPHCTGPENYCRNTDNSTLGPWCYTMDPKIRWTYCDVPYCNGFGANQECKYTQLGKEYQGKKNTTGSGIPCQGWHDNGPHTIPISNPGPENYCRNPDNSPEGPWCYTMDPNIVWDYCDVPYCNILIRKTCRRTHKNYDGDLWDESVADSQIHCINLCLSTQRCDVAVFDRIQSKCFLKLEKPDGTLYDDLNCDTFLLNCKTEECN